MSSTVNFTGSVDRDLLKRAKIIAAKSETSVNDLFNAELRYLVDTYEAAETSGNQNFKVLLDFSLGRCDDHERHGGPRDRQRGRSLPAHGLGAFAHASPAGRADPGHGRDAQDPGQSVTGQPPTLVLPDAGPLITLDYADALDLLLKPGWPVWIVDMVLHEVTRNPTPTSQAIAAWADSSGAVIGATRTFSHYQQRLRAEPDPPRKAGLGELAVQETMHELALMEPPPTGVFLFEDHKIARASLLVPANCHKVSTRAFLWYPQDQGWLESAAGVEPRAILMGRQLSKLKFPTGEG